MESLVPSYSSWNSLSPLASHQIDWTIDESDHFDAVTMNFLFANTKPKPQTTEPPPLVAQHEQNPQIAPQQFSRTSATYSRSKGPPAAEWERQRSKILQLYIEEGQQLEDVVCMMKEQFDFHAKAQMYKKKLKFWNCRKNYSRKQKEDVILQQDRSKLPFTSESHRNVPIVLNNKPVQQHRIERYRRRTVRGLSCEGESPLSVFHPHLSPEIYSVEIILLKTKHYSNWWLSQPGPDVGQGGIIIGHEVFECIVWGANSLDEDPRRAFTSLNRACSKIHGLLEQPTLDLCYRLLHYCGNVDWWKDHQQIRVALLKYIHAMVRHSLGPQHPVSKVLSLLVNEKVLWPAEFMLRLGRLLLDSARERVHGESLETSLWYQLNLISSTLINPGNLESAAKYIPIILTKIENTFTRSHWLLRRAKYDEACLFYACGDLQKAEQEWLEVIMYGTECSDREDVFELSVYSCWRLGLLYDDEDRGLEAERYLRLTLEGALRRWGEHDATTQECFKDLVRFLERSGRHEDVTQLCQEFAAVDSSLDSYHLDRYIGEQAQDK